MDTTNDNGFIESPTEDDTTFLDEILSTGINVFISIDEMIEGLEALNEEELYVVLKSLLETKASVDLNMKVILECIKNVKSFCQSDATNQTMLLRLRKALME